MPERALFSYPPGSSHDDEVTSIVIHRPSDFVRGLPDNSLDFLARRVLDELARRGINRFDDIRTDWRNRVARPREVEFNDTVPQYVSSGEPSGDWGSIRIVLDEGRAAPWGSYYYGTGRLTTRRPDFVDPRDAHFRDAEGEQLPF